jgi:coenzyme F420-0:L-glutamate ligase/coenzyme F420-1:gamma-L-glutamate ligase
LARTVTVIGLENIGLVKAGDNVAQMILDATAAEGVGFMDGDVVVVSQKILSKADGLLVNIATLKPSAKAKSIARRTKKDPRLVELVLKDSAKVLRADKQVLIVARRNGFICINAGVDKSNVGGAHVFARLPLDADRSARELRLSLERGSGKRLAVVVGDTYSRPLRVGQIEFAIGLSGLEPIVDYRGQKDLFGYELRFKYVGLADEIAAAAELVMGQGTEGIPVAIVRGLGRINRSEVDGLSRKLLLGRRLDLFGRML